MPPIGFRELLQDPGLPLGHRLEVGPLAAFLGERIDPDEFFDGTFPEDCTPERLARIVAYPLTCLEGKVFDFATPREIADRLNALLAEFFGDVLPADPVEDLRSVGGVFEKYRFVVLGFIAPPHPKTNQPMAIEIFADTKAPGQMEVLVATYANITCGGCRVSFQ